MISSYPRAAGTLAALALWLGVGLAGPAPAAGQEPDLQRCEAAVRVLEDEGMSAVVEPDTLDDWRSDLMLPACRITAAGVTTRELGPLATDFYDRLRSRPGWARTPDPRDSPNEASLRFRNEGADCLFNFYSGLILNTVSEREVSTEQVPGDGEERYQLMVLCTEAVAAVP